MSVAPLRSLTAAPKSSHPLPKMSSERIPAELPAVGDAAAELGLEGGLLPDEVEAALLLAGHGRPGVGLGLGARLRAEPLLGLGLGRKRVRHFHLCQARISIGFHSIWLIFGRAIISRDELKA